MKRTREELKNDPELTKDNYHSQEMRMKYMGYSQYKMFTECEVKGLAYVLGEYEPKKTPSLLCGSYFDAAFSEELDEFKAQNPDIFNSRTGELKSDYKDVETYIAAVRNDPVANAYWGGEHQVIMTGEIEGVPVKIKIDSYFEDKAIVDGKLMKDMEDVWVEEDGRNVRTNFIMAYHYDWEGAFYQEIERQRYNRGNEKLPFYLNVTTKQEVPDKEVILIDQDILDAALDDIKENIKRYHSIKQGLIQPVGCGKCPVCLSKKKASVTTYKKLFFHDEDEE